jgi:hypothetical protein
MMNLSKSDETYSRASFDESARKELLQQMKKKRRVLIWIFWGNLAFLLATVIFCFWQVAPILNGNFASFNPSSSIPPEIGFGAIGFSGVLGVFSVFGWVAADLRVKMLIMIGSLEHRMPHRTQSEQSAHPTAGNVKI